ncbi:TetR/AcrR family transcriptional regulator [Phyllobacterium phragmitis]|uniref:HTH tetR-type domain-containing protein n=1 Tax=Phyllobacterium phragmitis TaxID=2670329 RepID=A0ABQ0GVZ4_9HYPH
MAQRHHNRRGSVTIDQILDSAEEILVSRGVSGLTLEAVARQAGISKGGLLHHFPSKSALEAGVEQRFVSTMCERISQRARQGGSFLSALVMEMRNYREQGSRSLAAFTLCASRDHSPEALQAFGRKLLMRMEQSHPKERYRSLVFFALLGLLLSDVWHLVELSDWETQEFYAALEELVDQHPCATRLNTGKGESNDISPV